MGSRLEIYWVVKHLVTRSQTEKTHPVQTCICSVIDSIHIYWGPTTCWASCWKLGCERDRHGFFLWRGKRVWVCHPGLAKLYMVVTSQIDEGAIIIGVRMRELLVPLLSRPNDWWGTEKKFVQITFISQKKIYMEFAIDWMFVSPHQIYMLNPHLS